MNLLIGLDARTDTNRVYRFKNVFALGIRLGGKEDRRPTGKAAPEDLRQNQRFTRLVKAKNRFLSAYSKHLKAIVTNDKNIEIKEFSAEMIRRLSLRFLQKSPFTKPFHSILLVDSVILSK